MPGISSCFFTPSGPKVLSQQRTSWFAPLPVNVTLLFRACPGLVAMRLCHAVCDFASFCSRVPAENREAHLLVQTAFAFGVPLKSPHFNFGRGRLSAFAMKAVSHPSVGSRISGGSGRPRRALNASVPSSSVSPDSHVSAGVSHGFLSLRTILSAGSVRVSCSNISSSSCGTSSRPPSLCQHHGSIHGSDH